MDSINSSAALFATTVAEQQWYNYSSDDDMSIMMEESDYFAASGYIKPPSKRHPHHGGQRRLSLNNCTNLNMTFLANYNVSTADKSDLDVDCHNYFDENKASCSNSSSSSGGGGGGGDTMSVGTTQSSDNNNDHHHKTESMVTTEKQQNQSKSSNAVTVSDDDNDEEQYYKNHQKYRHVNVDDDNDDDDDDDMASFGEAEDAEPADEEYIRKNLGASCIWNDDAETLGLPAPPQHPIRRGGKKNSSAAMVLTRKMTHPGNGEIDRSGDGTHNEDDEAHMGLTNTSNNSNPITNDSARTTSSCEFTVVNTHPIGTTTMIVSHKPSSFLIYPNQNPEEEEDNDDTRRVGNDQPMHDPFDQDDDDGCDTMDIYYDETLDATTAAVTMDDDAAVSIPTDHMLNHNSNNNNHEYLENRHHHHDDDDDVEVDYHTHDHDSADYHHDNDDDIDHCSDGYDNDEDYDDDDDSDCDSFCDAHENDKADRDYMKRILGSSLYWNNSVEDLSYGGTTTTTTTTGGGSNTNDHGSSTPATASNNGVKRSVSKRSTSGRSNKSGTAK
jgi:hypothetical protein